MMIIYKAPVSSLSDIELEKLCALIGDSFDRDIGIPHVRSFDYGVVVQSGGVHVSVMLVKVEEGVEHNVQNLCVNPSFRNQGLATSMLEKLVFGLDPGEYASLHVDAGQTHDSLVSFYEKRGFGVVNSNERETFMCCHVL